MKPSKRMCKLLIFQDFSPIQNLMPKLKLLTIRKKKPIFSKKSEQPVILADYWIQNLLELILFV